MTELKICTRCNRELPVSAFCRQSAARDGMACGCKECLKKYIKAHWAVYARQKKKLNGPYWLKNRAAINRKRREKRAAK